MTRTHDDAEALFRSLAYSVLSDHVKRHGEGSTGGVNLLVRAGRHEVFVGFDLGNTSVATSFPVGLPPRGARVSLARALVALLDVRTVHDEPEDDHG